MRKSLLGGAAFVVLGLAACGASTGHRAAEPAPPAPAAAAPAPATTVLPPAASAPATTAVVVHDSPTRGAYLTGPAGQTLYFSTHDHGTNSACTGTCASVWPALVSPDPIGGPGVIAADLGTADGQVPSQVTYAGHLLYYFSGDTGAGTTYGLSIAGWLLIGPAGQPEGAPAAVPATPAPTVAHPPVVVTHPTPPMTAPRPPMTVLRPPMTVPKPAINPIPQGNGGDHDGDNNGGPSDGDGTV
jgi:predicted lipoprotein with Yx(FWY)xxD motif